MEPQSAAGRRLVLAIVVATLALSVLVDVMLITNRGSERLWDIVRFLLTVGLCVFLYRGVNWARWVASILFALGGLRSLIGGGTILARSMAGLLLLGMGLVYVASAVILLFVPTVKAYFGVGKPKAG